MKHYNIFALQGHDTTDHEVCQELGLSPNLAGTPGINEAAIMKMHKENVEGYMAQGMTSEKAHEEANKSAAAARQRVADLMRK